MDRFRSKTSVSSKRAGGRAARRLRFGLPLRRSPRADCAEAIANIEALASQK
jgi:hypothetical protein